MKTTENITLVGMPSAGKSTVGVLLAKRLGPKFIDSDLLIQEREGRLLKEIIAQDGMDGFMRIENEVNAGILETHSVIAPGGSVIYYKEAMEHLSSISLIVYLHISYEEMVRRIGNIKDRGVVLKDGMSLLDLYEERAALYETYADLTIDEEGLGCGQVVDLLREKIEKKDLD